jgi:hypothetical protein
MLARLLLFVVGAQEFPQGILRRKSKMKAIRTPSLLLGAVAFAALAFTGCLNDATPRTGDSRITLAMKVPDMDKAAKGALGKGSAVKLKKLIITMTSNVETDVPVHDTILASDTVGSTFTSRTDTAQSFTKAYAVKPLRHWTIVVKTLDTRDSVIHKDSVQALNLLAGETRNVPFNLDARYVMYEVKFSVPDSLRSSVSNQAQKIIITRFVMKIDSAVAIDSSRPSGFAGAPTVHTSTFDYIPANTTPDVTIQFFGHSAGTNDTLLFQAIIPDVNPEVEQPPVNAIYVGPGADGTGGAINRLIINIGKINTIKFNTNVNDTIAVKRAAR